MIENYHAAAAASFKYFCSQSVQVLADEEVSLIDDRLKTLKLDVMVGGERGRLVIGGGNFPDARTLPIF
jgi:hypothetical protein